MASRLAALCAGLHDGASKGGDEHEAAGRVEHQGFDHGEASFALGRSEAGHQIGTEPAQDDGRQADQADGDGEREDRAGETGEIHGAPGRRIRSPG